MPDNPPAVSAVRADNGRMRFAQALLPVMAATALEVAAQSRLAPCPGTFNTARWSNCFGEAMTPTGAKYSGEWRNDKFEGRGTYTYRNGAKYVGEFSNNRRNGEGSFTYRDGATYVGGYRDDQRSGRGTFTYPDGAKYVGEYKDDKQHGQGTEYRAGGSVARSGTWDNDRFVGSR